MDHYWYIYRAPNCNISPVLKSKGEFILCRINGRIAHGSRTIRNQGRRVRLVKPAVAVAVVGKCLFPTLISADGFRRVFNSVE